MADLALKAVASLYHSGVSVVADSATRISSSARKLDDKWQGGSQPRSSMGSLIDVASSPLQLAQRDLARSSRVATRTVTASVSQGSASTGADLSDLLTDQRLLFLSACEVDDFLDPLISRVGMLAQLAAEEEDQEAVRSDSFAGFLRFLYAHRPRIWRRPQLVLTPEGHLRAEWRETRDHRIAVRFLDENRVTFVFFAPDPHDPTQISRVGGSSSVYSFFETIPNVCGGMVRLFGKDIRADDAE